MRLLRVELQRLWARRVTRWMCVLALAVVALSAVSAFGSAMPPSDAQLAEAERAYQEQRDWWDENGEEELAGCQEQEASDPDPNADYGCEYMEPQLEHFLPPTTTFVADDGAEPVDVFEGDDGADVDPQVASIQASQWNGWSGVGMLDEVAVAFLLLAFVVGVSFVTAEVSSGSLGMWLTFEPRRQRVYWSKAAAAGLGTVPHVLLGFAATVGASVAFFAYFGALGDPTSDTWLQVAAYTGRLVVAGVGVSAVGVALGMLLRHAAAAIGVVVVVLWASGTFAFQLGEAQRWLPTVNLSAWLSAGKTFSVEKCTRGDDGSYACTYVDHAVSQTQGGLYVLAVAAALTILAALVFRRRDVS